MQTSNPDINIVFVIGTVDVCLAEKYIHEYLKHLNYEKEFFYVSSLDKAKEIVNFIVNFVNECIGKYLKYMLNKCMYLFNISDACCQICRNKPNHFVGRRTTNDY